MVASMDVEGAAAAYKSCEQKFGDDVPIRTCAFGPRPTRRPRRTLQENNEPREAKHGEWSATPILGSRPWRTSNCEIARDCLDD
jgi:hypothetical protein